MCIYFTVLFTVYKCHCVNMLCSPLAEENKVSIYLNTSNAVEALWKHCLTRCANAKPRRLF